MDYEELMKQVDTRVNEVLPEALISALVVQHSHSKVALWECPCEFCVLKRNATIHIGTPRTYKLISRTVLDGYAWDMFGSMHFRSLYDEWEKRRVVRAVIRDRYREQLLELLQRSL